MKKYISLAFAISITLFFFGVVSTASAVDGIAPVDAPDCSSSEQPPGDGQQRQVTPDNLPPDVVYTRWVLTFERLDDGEIWVWVQRQSRSDATGADQWEDDGDAYPIIVNDCGEGQDGTDIDKNSAVFHGGRRMRLRNL